jgi:flagellin
MKVDPILSYSFTSLSPIIHANASANTKAASSMSKLSSGLRIQTAGDDPAGLAESERLRSLISRYDAAVSNSENAESYLQTADSYMQNISDTIGRMQELAVAANDGTKTDTDRAALQAEFGQLQESITNITSGTSPLASFNGSPIFQGESKSIAIGPEIGQELQIVPIDLTSTSAQNIGTDTQGNPIQWNNILTDGGSGINISSQDSAKDALDKLGAALDYVSSSRAQMGAQYSALSSNAEGLRSAQMNSLSRESSIRDLDYARETVNLVKFLSLGQINRSIIAKTTGNILATA